MKKLGTEQYIPQIKDGFIKTMKENYNVPEEEAEKIIVKFLKVIEDASSYLFSLNHSLPYSYIGYICGWLRYYYPLEFLSVALNINEDDQEKTGKIYDYIRDFTKIKVKPIKFRHSKDVYTINKEENSIYKGIKSIKYCNSNIAIELYNLRNNTYDSFIDLLYDISEKTSLNNRQLDILIKLDYFSEFGNSKLLSNIVKYFEMFKRGKSKQINVDKVLSDEMLNNIIKRYSRLSPSGKLYTNLKVKPLLKEIEELLRCSNIKDYDILQKIKFHKEYLGYIDLTTGNEEDRRKLLVLNVTPLVSKKNNKTWAYAIDVISIGSGRKSRLNIWSNKFDKIPLCKYDIIFASKLEKNDKGYWYLLDYYKIQI